MRTTATQLVTQFTCPFLRYVSYEMKEPLPVWGTRRRFGNVIHALVRDLITPLIAAIGAQPDFGSLAFTVNRARFRYGDVIDATLEFLIIAAVVYFLVVAPMNRLLALRRGPERPTIRQCSECLSEIPREARRCSYCTSPQVPEPV